MAEENEGVVCLPRREFVLFNFLKSRLADSFKGVSDIEIKEKLGLSSVSEVKKVISSLRKKEGILIHLETTGSGNDKMVTYTLSPENLETLALRDDFPHHSSDSNITYGALYLAEPAFGTKAFEDKYTMKGLALALEVNGMAKNIQQVIVQGGMIPHIPPFTSKGYTGDMKFIGYIGRKPGEQKSQSEIILEERLDNVFEREFYNKEVNNPERRKITTLTDAYSVAGEQLQILMEVFPETTFLRVQAGEEDRKNIAYLVEELAREGTKRKSDKIKEITQDLSDRKAELQESYAKTVIKRNFLQHFLRHKSIARREGEEKKEYYQRMERFSKNFTDQLEGSIDIPSEISEKLKKEDEKREGNAGEEWKKRILTEGTREILDSVYYLTRKGYDPQNLKIRLSQLEKELITSDDELELLDSKVENMNSSLNWTKQLLETRRAAITRFTKQYPQSADDAEVDWKKAKDAYSWPFYGFKISQQSTFHISPRKRVSIETATLKDISSGEADKPEVEYSVAKHNQKTILLIHNLRHVFSDTTSPSGIKDAKLLMNYENMVLKKFFSKELDRIQPDVILLGGHQTGGFRVMPWSKDSDSPEEGVFVKGKRIGYMINLPTLQYIPYLERLVEKGFSNWHTKRLRDPYASAAVIHTEDKEGVNNFTVIDTARLVEFGKISDAIEVYRTELKNKKLSKQKRGDIKNLIEQEKQKVRADFTKIEVAGDFHLGAPDHPDRYSKDQLIKAMQIYQKEHGLPAIISWDEILHGVMEKTFKSSTRYEAMTPEVFYQRKLTPIMNDASLSQEERAKMVVNESMRNQRAITIHNLSEQKRLFRVLLKEPYADGALEDGSRLVLTSGNHANLSSPFEDEALELANQFDSRYINEGQVIPFTGKGNPVGTGRIKILNGSSLFAMHKFPERQDEIYGIMCHLRKMNNDADLVIAGDRHQTGAGYADGILSVLHPGMESRNKFCDLIGKPAGLRGFNNAYIDPFKKGFCAVDFIVDNTLEPIIEKHKIV